MKRYGNSEAVIFSPCLDGPRSTGLCNALDSARCSFACLLAVAVNCDACFLLLGLSSKVVCTATFASCLFNVHDLWLRCSDDTICIVLQHGREI